MGSRGSFKVYDLVTECPGSATFDAKFTRVGCIVEASVSLDILTIGTGVSMSIESILESAVYRVDIEDLIVIWAKSFSTLRISIHRNPPLGQRT